MIKASRVQPTSGSENPTIASAIAAYPTPRHGAFGRARRGGLPRSLLESRAGRRFHQIRYSRMTIAARPTDKVTTVPHRPEKFLGMPPRSVADSSRAISGCLHELRQRSKVVLGEEPRSRLATSPPCCDWPLLARSQSIWKQAEARPIVGSVQDEGHSGIRRVDVGQF